MLCTNAAASEYFHADAAEELHGLPSWQSPLLVRSTVGLGWQKNSLEELSVCLLFRCTCSNTKLFSKYIASNMYMFYKYIASSSQRDSTADT